MILTITLYGRKLPFKYLYLYIFLTSHNSELTHLWNEKKNNCHEFIKRHLVIRKIYKLKTLIKYLSLHSVELLSGYKQVTWIVQTTHTHQLNRECRLYQIVTIKMNKMINKIPNKSVNFVDFLHRFAKSFEFYRLFIVFKILILDIFVFHFSSIVIDGDKVCGR